MDTTDAAVLAELAWRGEVPDSYREANPLWVQPMDPKEIVPGVYFLMSFANVSAVSTSSGWVLIDCAFNYLAEEIYGKLQQIKKMPIHTIVFTHGHVDHCSGAKTMEDCNRRDYQLDIRVVAHVNILARFERYAQTYRYNHLLNVKQFDADEHGLTFLDLRYPDLVYQDQLTLVVGDRTLKLRYDLGETDDHTWVWFPQEKILITGDFVLWNLCNCGNPQKVTRYPEEWAKALRKMEVLGAEFLFPGHGPYVSGKERVKQLLVDTYTALETIIYQTLTLINEGLPRHEIVKRIILPTYLLEKPYLRPYYADAEFIVQEIWRRKCGWWSGKLYDLKEMDMNLLGKNLLDLVGKECLMSHIRTLIEKDQFTFAWYYLELALYGYPEDRDLLLLAEQVCEHLGSFEVSPASMIRNQYKFRLKMIQSKL